MEGRRRAATAAENAVPSTSIGRSTRNRRANSVEKSNNTRSNSNGHTNIKNIIDDEGKKEVDATTRSKRTNASNNNNDSSDTSNTSGGNVDVGNISHPNSLNKSNSKNITLSNYSQLNEDRGKGCLMYFVLNNNLVEATCSSRLTMAFQLCKEFNLMVEWISEEECLKAKPKKGNIFVLDPFEGSVYQHLAKHFYSKQNFMIIGPQCIRQSLRGGTHNEIKHRGHPLFTLGMRDVVVTLTGFRNPAEKRKLLDLIEKMGGFYTSSYTKAVTHVIAEDILSPKCRAAYETGIPVMKPEWVEVVWKESLNDVAIASDGHFISYQCPVFYKLNICFSQIQSQQKSTLKQAIETNGGIFSSELLKGTTDILIILRGDGEKFRYAKQWNLPCLRPDWITDSITAKHVLGQQKYIVRLETENLTSTQLECNIRAPRGDVSCSMIDSDIRICHESHLTNVTKQNGTLLVTTDAVPFESDLNIFQGIEENQALDGCKIYISGIGNKKYDQARKLLNDCGATRLDRLSEAVSHIVVLGSALIEQELNILKTLNTIPHIVTVDWIIASARKGSPAEEDEFLFEVKQASSKLRSSINDENSSRTRSIADEEEQAPAPQEHFSENENVENRDGTFFQSQAASVTRIFAGNSFCILLKNSEESDEVKKCIEVMGGAVVQKSPEIIILPPVYSVDKNKAAPQLYTKFWMYDCQEINSPNIEIEFYHIPLKTFQGMTKIMTDVVVALSGYSCYQRKYIEAVATAMGAKFQDVFARKGSGNVFKSTHLICNVVDNDKYKAATRWNVPVVRHEWIIECFHERKRLDIAPFLLQKNSLESRGSILMETPVNKTNMSRQNRTEIYTATVKPPEKFVVPEPVLPTLKTPTQRNMDSPFYKGFTNTGSRQLKMALDFAASDSPSPDFSSLKISLKRKSTPELDAFSGAWQALRDRYPGSSNPSRESSCKGTDTAPHIFRIPSSGDKPMEVITNSERKKPKTTVAVNDCGNICNPMKSSMISTTSSFVRDGCSNSVYPALESSSSGVYSSPKIFIVTGISDAYEVDKYVEIISQLGGQVSKSSKYHPEIDALIAKKLARSEKVLGTIAAGKPVISHNYVLECEKAGKLLDLTEFILTPDLNMASYSALEKQLIQSAHYWHMKIRDDPNNKPFSNLSVLLVEPNEAKYASYKILIQAGGGEIWSQNNSTEIPNIIIGDNEAVKKKISTLPETFSTLSVKLPYYLNEVILKKTNID